jgi:hypothetical protein
LRYGTYQYLDTGTGIVDPHHFDAVPDGDRSLIFFYADPDADPTFHPGADPDADSDPRFQIKAQTLENVLK